jgi:hypothetical protein
MKYHYLILLILIILAACGTPSPKTTPFNPSLITAKPTEKTSYLAQPTPSTLSPSLTATMTPVQHDTPTTIPRVIPIAMKKEDLADGIILFNSPDKSEEVKIYQKDKAALETFISQKEYDIFLGISGNQMMSPDRRHAAIIRDVTEISEKGKYLIGTNGKTKTITNMEVLNARGIAYWLNDKQILFYPTGHIYPLGTLLLYNPFSRQLKIVQPTFPDLIDGYFYQVPNWGSAPIAPKYDPYLKRVVYYKLNADEKAISLWNLESKTEIWKRELMSDTAIPWSSEPAWSPDGSQFAIFLPDAERHETLELTLVDRDGKEKIIHDPTISKWVTWGGGITWSPDGRYLSLYIEEYLSVVRPLVYDLTLKQTWDPGVIEIRDQPMSGNPGGVIWSPDSKQFLVNNIGTIPFAYVVDVEKKLVYNFKYLFETAIWLKPNK